MSPSGDRATAPAIQTLKMLVGAVVGALFLMAVALSFVLGFGPPSPGVIVVLLLLGLFAHVLIEKVGYRAPPVPVDLDATAARNRGIAVFRSTLMMRLAMGESVAMFGLVFAFVGRTVLAYDLGAAISVLLLALHVWPSRRSVDRVVASLEKDGAQTGLSELLGFAGPMDGPMDGPIQRA